MTLSRVYLSSLAAFLLAGLISLSGCARLIGPPREEPHAGAGTLHVVVLPIANLSGATAPLKDLRHAIISGLTERSFPVLDEESLQAFMARHRVRDTGGIDSETGRALKEETGADAVLITSVELYGERFPPKIGVMSRLVSTGSDQRILWMDGRGLSGDDSPGILGLGLIRDPRRLVDKAVRSLLDSLSGAGKGTESAGKRFRPVVGYRSPVFSADMKYRVAVVPFFDRSGRKNAGEIMSLQFVRAMARLKNFEVIEPGVVRGKLLRYRLVLDRGVSLAQTDILFEALDADMILSGTVLSYEESQGALGVPNVEFSVQLIEKKSREVVWSSFSNNLGDDGVFFFDRGKVNTAQALAMRMAGQVVETMVEK